MSNPDPIQQLASDVLSIQSDVGNLQSSTRLSSARDALEDTDTSVNSLPQRVRDIRARGYLFEKELESKALDLAARWAALRVNVQHQIDVQAATLESDMRSIESQQTQLNAWSNNPDIAQPLVNQLRTSISALQGKVSAVEGGVRGMYDAFKSEVEQFTSRLKQIEWMQSQLAEACFQLLPGEGALDAVAASWCKQGRPANDDPQGVLFLTDQRLLFEQKQEVATKKVLFIATEKKKVQQLLVNVPVAQVHNAQASKQGFMSHEDHLDITFASGAPVRMTHFHLNGRDSNAWQALVMRARAHDFDAGRAVPIAQEQLERAKSVPSKCPTCGSPMTQTVLRGMDSIKCEFCGSLIRF